MGCSFSFLDNVCLKLYSVAVFSSWARHKAKGSGGFLDERWFLYLILSYLKLHHENDESSFTYTTLYSLFSFRYKNPMVLGCIAASALLRKAALAAFEKNKRSTLTTDIIEHLGERWSSLDINIIRYLTNRLNDFSFYFIENMLSLVPDFITLDQSHACPWP